MEDRRIFERIQTRIPVRFLDPVNGREGKAETFDISANGLGMTTDERLNVMTPLEIWLDIPDQHEPLYTRGEVVWAGQGDDKQHLGIHLERAELMGLARTLWLKRRG